MKKILIISLFAMMCLSLPTIYAATIIPVDVDITVDFNGEREFKIILPNGGQRLFSWSSGQTHSDTTFSHTIYETLDEERWCSDNSELNEYKAITAGLTNMLKTCNNVMSTVNTTDLLRTRVMEAERDFGICGTELASCKTLLSDKKNETVYWKDECNNYQQLYNNERDRAADLQSATNQARVCEADLQESIKAKNMWAIMGFGGGLAIGYYSWKRKKEGGPSEQAEAGYISDSVRFDPDQGFPGGFDGPRN